MVFVSTCSQLLFPITFLSRDQDLRINNCGSGIPLHPDVHPIYFTAEAQRTLKESQPCGHQKLSLRSLRLCGEYLLQVFRIFQCLNRSINKSGFPDI